jgi:hypothetical protein
MQGFLLANPPLAEYYVGIALGLAMAVGGLAWLFWRRRVRGQDVLMIAAAMLVAGPAFALGLVGLTMLLGGVYPMDRLYYLQVFLAIGAIAGVVLAVLAVVVGAIRLATQRADRPPEDSPAEPDADSL